MSSCYVYCVKIWWGSQIFESVPPQVMETLLVYLQRFSRRCGRVTLAMMHEAVQDFRPRVRSRPVFPQIDKSRQVREGERSPWDVRRYRLFAGGSCKYLQSSQSFVVRDRQRADLANAEAQPNGGNTIVRSFEQTVNLRQSWLINEPLR